MNESQCDALARETLKALAEDRAEPEDLQCFGVDGDAAEYVYHRAIRTGMIVPDSRDNAANIRRVTKAAREMRVK